MLFRIVCLMDFILIILFMAEHLHHTSLNIVERYIRIWDVFKPI